MTDKLYICPKAKGANCKNNHCTHYGTHYNGHCGYHLCNDEPIACIPLPDKSVCEDEPNYEDMALAEQKDKETQRKDWEREQYVEADKPSPVNDLEGIVEKLIVEMETYLGVEYHHYYEDMKQTAITEILDWVEKELMTEEVKGFQDIPDTDYRLRCEGRNEYRTELLSKIKLLRGGK